MPEDLSDYLPGTCIDSGMQQLAPDAGILALLWQDGRRGRRTGQNLPGQPVRTTYGSSRSKWGAITTSWKEEPT